MRLYNTAQRFNKMQVVDAYLDVDLFKAQLGVFDDMQRDAVNSLRRVLEVTPGTAMPARLAVRTPDGQNWVVGALPMTDVFKDRPIRTKYTLQACQYQAWLRTPGQVIANAGGTRAWSSYSYAKDARDATESETLPAYDVYLAMSEPLEEGVFVQMNGMLFRTRSMRLAELEFKVGLCDVMEYGVRAVMYTSFGVYDSVNDTHTATSAMRWGIFARFSQNFDYRISTAEPVAKGDLMGLVVSTPTFTPVTNDELAIDGLDYKVLSVQQEGDAWRLHLRP